MATPLSWFRKYSKTLMAIFGIALIAIFLVTMVIPSGSITGGSLRPMSEDPVVVRWKDGELRGREIGLLRQRHFQTLDFLQGLFEYASEKKKSTVKPRVPIITSILNEGDESNLEAADENIVSRFIVALNAGKEGIVISDTMVDDYLMLLVGDVSISNVELEAINRKVNDRLDFRQIREHLKLELASQQMNIFMQPGVNFPLNPTQAAQYYSMGTRMIECEVLPVKVDDFLSKITATPDPTQLAALYNRGKSHFPDKTNPKPGFKRGRKIALQYFVANFDTFLQNETNKLTDQQVQEEYDRRLKANDQSIMEENKPDVPAALVPETPIQGKPPVTEPEKSAPEAAVPETSVPPEKTEKKDGGLTASQNQEYFVSTPLPLQLQDPESTKQESSKEAATEKSATADSATDNAAQDVQRLEPVVDPKVEAEKAVSGSQDEPAAPSLRPKPLKDVADQLKREMKAKDAEESMSKALEAADSDVREFQFSHTEWESTPEVDRAKTAPLFNAKSIADKYQLEFLETGLLSIDELKEHSLGKLTRFFMGNQNGQRSPMFVSVEQYVTATFNKLNKYEPTLFEDAFSMGGGSTRQSILFWPIEKINPIVPSFEEAREELAAFWKREQALILARAEAAKIVTEMNSSDKSLTDVYGDRALKTGQFSWYSDTMGNFGYSRPVGIIGLGEEIMTTANALAVGKSGSAANDTSDIVYVIRMIADDTRPASELMKSFAKDLTPQKPFPQNVNAIANNYNQRTFVNWRNKFVDEMKIEWVGK